MMQATNDGCMKSASAGLTLLAALSALAGPATAVDAGATAQHIVQAANGFREAQALRALATQAELEAAARDFARFMAKSGK